MSTFAEIPLYVALPAALFLLIGSTLTLLGVLGLLRLENFFDRIHAPTLGTSWGTASILLASMFCWSWAEGGPVLHELVLGIFVMITTPITMMLLGRTALYRERVERNPDVPPAWAPKDPEEADEEAVPEVANFD